MKRVAVLLLCAVGCDVIEYPSNQEVPAPEGAGLAQEIAIDLWSGELDADLWHPPEVRWFEGACLSYDGRDPGGCLMGLFQTAALEEPQIHLAVEYPAVHRTALAHELLHWAIDESRGDSDHDHASPEWGLLGEAEERLAAAGL